MSTLPVLLASGYRYALDRTIPGLQLRRCRYDKGMVIRISLPM